MTTTEVERLAAEVREQNDLYEHGDTDRAFWLGQRHRLEQIRVAEPKLSQKVIGELVGKSRDWVRDVLAWDERILASPWAGPRGENREASTARKVLGQRPAELAPAIAEALADPDVAEQVARNMSSDALETVTDATSRVGWERGRAERRERDARDHGPSVGDVAGETGETADELRDSMSEQWADVPMSRAIARIGELHGHVQHWGLTFSGGDTPEGHAEEVEWLDRLLTAEARLAEVRAALQERVRDRGGATRKGAQV